MIKKLDLDLPISCFVYKEEEFWTIRTQTPATIQSLKNLSAFEIFLMKVAQHRTEIVIEDDYEEAYVTPNKKPELNYD